MLQNHTPSAKIMLSEMFEIIKSWVDLETTIVTIDDRFHVDQVFDPQAVNAGRYYNAVREISRTYDRSAPARYYAGSSARASDDKIDLITTIVHEVSMQDALARDQDVPAEMSTPHTVIFCDDRFSEALENSLMPMVDFFDKAPELIPRGLELKIIQLDPYENHCDLEDFFMQGSGLQDQSGSTRAKLNVKPMLTHKFLRRHHRMMDDNAFESVMDGYQSALSEKKIINGRGSEGRDFNFGNCWTEFLVPVAKEYAKYLENPHDYSVACVYLHDTAQYTGGTLFDVQRHEVGKDSDIAAYISELSEQTASIIQKGPSG